MPQISSNITLTLNGVTPLSFPGGQTIEWYDRYIEVVPISMPSGQSTSPTATLNFTGNWDWVFAIRFGGTPGVYAVINDTGTGTRGLDYIRLSAAGGKINLNATEVGMIVGKAGVDNVSLGSKYTRSVSLADGDDIVLTRTGFVGTVETGGGNDTVTVGVGGANYIGLGNGDNVLTTTTGFVSSILAYDGADRATIGAGGADSVNLGHGDNVLTTGTGMVGSIILYSGADTVNLGAGGADSVSLGAGDDIINFTKLTNPDNLVTVLGGQGVDTASFAKFNTAMTIKLGAVSDTGAGNVLLVGVENVTGGSGADSITGDAAANELIGGAGNDVLNGGLGTDRLTGGVGADAFVFDVSSVSAGVFSGGDAIVDFNRTQLDKIWLDDDVFASLGSGFAAGNFRAGAAAADANDYVIYNKTTGQLFYDADGNGAGAAVLIATLTNKAALAFSDFVVV